MKIMYSTFQILFPSAQPNAIVIVLLFSLAPLLIPIQMLLLLLLLLGAALVGNFYLWFFYVNAPK